MSSEVDKINEILPDDIQVDKKLNSDALSDVLTEVSKKHPDKFADIAMKLRRLGMGKTFEMGFSVGIDDVDFLEGRDEIVNRAKKDLEQTDEEDESAVADIGGKYGREIESKMVDQLQKSENHFYDMVAAGARGSTDQLRQMLATPLMLRDPQNKPVPSLVEKSYGEGLSFPEYFITSYGARKGVMDRRLAMQKPGEISKNLLRTVNRQIISEEDCGTSHGLEKSINNPSIMGRTLASNVGDIASKNQMIDENLIQTFKKDGVETVEIRSPVTCEADQGICKQCYGNDESGSLPTIGDNVGTKAGQALGEPISQMAMNCSVGLIRDSEQGFTTMKDYFWGVDAKIKNNGHVATKKINRKILDDGKEVKAKAVQMHEPDDDMFFIRTKSGRSMVVQGNHPVWEYSGGHPNVKRADTIEEEDKLSIDRSWIEELEHDKEIPLPGYYLGLFAAEGITRVRNEMGGAYDDSPVASIITQPNGPIKDKAYELIKHIDGASKNKLDIQLYNTDFAADMMSWVRGREAKFKRIMPGFEKFPKEEIAGIIAGLIDGDGSVFNRPHSGTRAKLYTSSYELLQQVEVMCEILDARCTTHVATERDCQHSVHFTATMQFSDKKIYNKSVKMQKKDFRPLTETLNRGKYEKVNYIKKLWCWNHPVYDVKTETEGFTMGCIRNHNTFHSGGVVQGGDDVDVIEGLPRIDELMSMKNNVSGQAPLADRTGRIENVEEAEAGGHRVKIKDNQGDSSTEFVGPDRDLFVSEGDEIKRGDKLSSGVPDPRKMNKLVGLHETRKRIADEMKTAYKGFDINDGVFETVVRGITDLVRIVDPGDEDEYVPGDYESYQKVHAKNLERSEEKPVNRATGQYAARDYNTDNTVVKEGEEISEEQANVLRDDGINSIKVTDNPIRFKPKMAGITSMNRYMPDFLTRLGFSRLKSGLQESIAHGTESDINSYQPIPPYAYGSGFGEGDLPGEY